MKAEDKNQKIKLLKQAKTEAGNGMRNVASAESGVRSAYGF